LKKIFFAVIKFTIPLSCGAFLIWFIYKDISEENRTIIWKSFREANYYWIGLSFLIGALSHLSRALRWLQLVKPLGYSPNPENSFFAVMVGYLANMAFPRLGEVSRCAVLSRYENIPLEKGFGTVMAERVLDMLILLCLFAIVVVSQIKILWTFVSIQILSPVTAKINDLPSVKLILGMILAGGVCLAILFLFKKIMKPFYQKLRALLKGFGEGFTAIMKVENKLIFIFHTLFIWLMYFLMLYVCFYSLPETSNVPIAGVLACFVLGSIGIVAVQGGIGAYQFIVTQTLLLYGISEPIGFALGWIAWTGQAVMILILGFLSLLLLPLFNKKQKNEQGSTDTIQNIPA
jgi:glycosyltransferase 2 family protein